MRIVHLVSPLDLALDARITEDEARFVRSGCRPNIDLRPVPCHAKSPQNNRKEHHADEDETTLLFVIFAPRDLKPPRIVP